MGPRRVLEELLNPACRCTGRECSCPGGVRLRIVGLEGARPEELARGDAVVVEPGGAGCGGPVERGEGRGGADEA